jgi:hypothetical protein
LPVALEDATLLVQTTINYQAQLNGLAAHAGRIAREVWSELGGTDREFIEVFKREAAPVVLGARQEAIDLTSAYLHELTDQAPKSMDLDLLEPRWRDPFLRTWRELKKGKEWVDAKESGAGQAQAITIDAVQSGAIGRMTHSGILGIVGFRRVLQPGACDWCRLVSVQRYHSAEAASFGHGHDKHNSCRCTVVAIYGKRDPGRTINASRLAELKAEGVVDKVSKANQRKRDRVVPGTPGPIERSDAAKAVDKLMAELRSS